MHLCRAVGDDADHLREAAQKCALNTILRDADKDPEALDPVLRHACAELRLRINQLCRCDDRELGRLEQELGRTLPNIKIKNKTTIRIL